MLAGAHRETLETFCQRVRCHRFLRIAGVGAVAILTVSAGVWPAICALVWATAYIAAEFSLEAWWSAVQPRLAAADDAGLDTLRQELTSICAIACGVGAIPCVFAPFAGGDGQALAVMLATAILLVVFGGKLVRLLANLLPSAGQFASSDEAPPQPSQPVAVDRPALRILAVEADETSRQSLRSLLAPLGHELTLVADGAEAVEASMTQPFDAVLVAVQKPPTDGLAASAALRRAESAAGRQRTPILALTAEPMTHQIEACLAAGMDDFVDKPIELGALLRALEAVMDKASDATVDAFERAIA
jgi:CheY-like chemotaxis protein